MVKILISFKRTEQDFILTAYSGNANKKCCQPEKATALYI